MDKKRKPKAYTSGVLVIYKAKALENDFGATIKPKKLDDFAYVCKLNYNERFKRASDIEYANSLHVSLNLKVSTPLYKGVTTKMYAVTNHVIYSIYDIDYDEVGKELYLYLEEFAKC